MGVQCEAKRQALQALQHRYGTPAWDSRPDSAAHRLGLGAGAAAGMAPGLSVWFSAMNCLTCRQRCMCQGGEQRERQP